MGSGGERGGAGSEVQLQSVQGEEEERMQALLKVIPVVQMTRRVADFQYFVNFQLRVGYQIARGSQLAAAMALLQAAHCWARRLRGLWRKGAGSFSSMAFSAMRRRMTHTKKKRRSLAARRALGAVCRGSRLQSST